MHLLIDADSLVYAAGFAVERKNERGIRVAEPVSHALKCVDNMINAIVTQVALKAQESCTYTLYLTGKGNYREAEATIHKYKGNRKAGARPIHFEALRTYLVDQWGAELVNGIEADDAVTIEMYKAEQETTVLCSIDKDLEQVPGLHYNWKRKEFNIISPIEARRAFWKQVLVGDAVDNIKGLHLCGPAKAKKIMNGTAWIEDPDMYDVAMYQTCLVHYTDSFRKDHTRYEPHPDGESAMNENCVLLHMLQDAHENWALYMTRRIKASARRIP